MNKIKVCHIITKLELGGAQQNTLYTIEHLDKERFAPVLISGKGGILDTEAHVISGTKVYFANNLVREINPIKDLLAIIELWALLKKEKPDIVHTHSSKAGILGRWAAKLSGTPVIIHTFHGFGFNDFQKSLMKYLFVFLEKITAKITDKLIAVSKNNIEKGIKYGIGYPEKYTLIRSGIDIKKYTNFTADKNTKKKELGISPEEKVITTIGPFKPQKNLSDFINAAKQISEKFRNCKFLIIGDGEQKSYLEKLINESMLQDKVKILGWRRDIPEILAVSDIFILTSLWEGLPRSVLEAMSSGLPVIANEVDGVEEVIRNNENGFLTKPFEIEKTSEYAVKLLNDDKSAKSFGLKAKEAIDKQFDIDYMVEQQDELYKSLLQN